MISLLSKLNLDPPIQECGWYHAAHVSTLTGWDSQIEERNCEKQSEYCCSFEGARLTYHALEIQKTPNKHSTSNGAMGEAETAGLSAHDKTKENNISNSKWLRLAIFSEGREGPGRMPCRGTYLCMRAIYT